MLYQYYILEIQKYQDGTYGHIVHIAYDEDEETARLKGDSKYYEVLSSAAVSSLPQHSVVLMESTGRFIDNKCYRHNTTPATP